jgi:hypothetical protein
MPEKKKLTQKQRKALLLKHLAKASLSLGAASAVAHQTQDFDLVEKIINIARQSERLEMQVTGRPIDRSKKK